MSKFLRTAIVITSITVAASVAQAQEVGMAGSYIEGNGIIVNIPQNPPQVDCIPVGDSEPRPAGSSAWCINKRNLLPGSLIPGTNPTQPSRTMIPPATTGTPNAVPYVNNGPNVGVMGARNIATPGSAQDALNPGGQFTVPPLAFTQRLGQQVGQVIGGGAVVQLDTTFTAAMPGTDREKNNGISRFIYTITENGGREQIGENPSFVGNPLTRVMQRNSFSATDVEANGFNNGLSTANENYRYRQALTTTKFDTYAADNLRMVYANGDSPDGMGFGGTMTILLDGGGRLYLDTPAIEGAFPTALRPVVATNPVGDTIPGLNDRNAGGWEITAPGRQVPGIIKAFGPGILFIPTSMNTAPSPPSNVNALIPNLNIKGEPCGQTAFDDTCNLIGWTYAEGEEPVRGGSFFQQGFTAGQLPGADSTKFMFGWTTGTVSIVRTGPRGGVVQTLTQTGMGYDSTTPGGNRNVGLVAGSYTKREDATAQQMNTQLAGIDLQFTPEPGATIALISGLGLLGALGARRRS